MLDPTELFWNGQQWLFHSSQIKNTWCILERFVWLGQAGWSQAENGEISNSFLSDADFNHTEMGKNLTGKRRKRKCKPGKWALSEFGLSGIPGPFPRTPTRFFFVLVVNDNNVQYKKKIGIWEKSFVFHSNGFFLSSGFRFILFPDYIWVRNVCCTPVSVLAANMTGSIAF